MKFFKQLTVEKNHQVNDFKNILENTKVLYLKKEQTEEDGNYYAQLARQAGFITTFEEDTETGLLREEWLQIKYIPELSEKTYKHSNKFQPLHTDYCNFSIIVEISFFYCLQQAEFGGATYFIDAKAVADLMKKYAPSLYKTITTETIRYNKGEDEFSFREDKILKIDENGEYLISWNYYRIQKTDEKSVKLGNEFKSFLDTYVENSGEQIYVKLMPGDAIFFHDTKILHGRCSFLGERHLNKGGIIMNDIENRKNILLNHLRKYSNA